jgi:hypothetical protein
MVEKHQGLFPMGYLSSEDKVYIQEGEGNGKWHFDENRAGYRDGGENGMGDEYENEVGSRDENDSDSDRDAEELTRSRTMSRLRRFRSRSRTSMTSTVSEEHLRGTPAL